MTARRWSLWRTSATGHGACPIRVESGSLADMRWALDTTARRADERALLFIRPDGWVPKTREGKADDDA